MAAGLVTSALVEVEWLPGVWTDVTADVEWPDGVTIDVGRSSEWDDIQPGTLAMTLLNDGAYTPGNPLSPHWPGVVKGARVRYSVVRGGVTYWRFRGRLKTIETGSVQYGRATVALTAVDALGDMQSRRLALDWVEQWEARAAAPEVADCWPMDDDAPTATTIRNATGSGTMTVVPASTGAGTWELGQVNQGLMLPGAVSLSPASGVGPVLAVDLGRTIGGGVITWATGTSQTVASGTLTLVQGLDGSGVPLWSLRLRASGANTDLCVYDDAAGTYAVWVAAVNGDDTWMACSVYDSGANSVWYRNNADGMLSGVNTASTRYLILGGRAGSWLLLGKQSECCPVAVAGVAAAETSTTDLLNYVRPSVTTAANTRASELIATYCALTRVGSGSLVPTVARTPTAGRTALEALAQLVGTVCGTAYGRYTADDTVVTVWPDNARPRTSSATVTIELDDSTAAALRWVGPGDTRTTRVTVSSPAGSRTARDAYLEDVVVLRQDETWDSCAATVAAAGALAGARLNRSLAPRVAQLGVDLATAQTDLYASVLGLHPGDRVTLAGLPSTQLGITALDCYALGWSEKWTDTGALFTLDLVPADAPPELVLDSTTYGRLGAGVTAAGVSLMTVTGGTAVGATGAGTLVITTSAGPTLTTDAAAYPLDLDWLKERVTLSSARENVLYNGTFEAASVDPWGAVGGTLTLEATIVHGGSYAARLETGSGATPRIRSELIPCMVGDSVTASAWIRVNTARTASLDINWYTAAGAYISTSSQSQALAADTWTSYGVTATAPATAAQFRVQATNSGTPGAGLYLYADDVTATIPGVRQAVISVRGVAPTVARVHAAGEGIDAWLAATVAGI